MAKAGRTQNHEETLQTTKEGEQTEDNSCERGVESQLRAAAQRGYPY